MGAIADLSDLVSRASGGSSGAPERIWRMYDSRVGANAAIPAIASRWISLWNYNNTYNPVSTFPGAVSAPTRTTAGALGQANAAGGMERQLLGIEGILVPGTLLMYDRLLHLSDLSGTSITEQAVGGTLTRNTGGVGNQIWIEIYDLIGATSRTITARYTNQNGDPNRVTQAVSIGNTGLREAQRMIPLVLQSGDTGVRSVEGTTLSASTGTVGNFGVTVVRPLMSAFCASNGGPLMRDLVSGLPPIQKVDTDACIAFAVLPWTTSTPVGVVAPMFVDA